VNNAEYAAGTPYLDGGHAAIKGKTISKGTDFGGHLLE